MFYTPATREDKNFKCDIYNRIKNMKYLGTYLMKIWKISLRKIIKLYCEA